MKQTRKQRASRNQKFLSKTYFTDLEIFYSVQQIRVTPTLVYVRLVYAVVILIKLSISTNTTKLGQALNPEDIKVSLYLEKLLVHLKAVATLDNQEIHTLGAKFLQILTKIKFWFQRQGKPNRPANEETWPVVNFEPPRPTELKQEDPLQYTDKANFLTDFSKAPTMNTTAWPDQSQSSMGYSDPSYFSQPSWDAMGPFDFPMDLDPDLFTHLIQDDQNLNYLDSGTSDGSAFNQMDYLNNMPDFSSWPMQ